MIKKILIGLLIALVVIQFIRPERNLSGDTKNDISTKYPMPDSVKAIVTKACADCHSNKTEMPLKSYTLIHKEADLTEAERVILTKWCQSIMDTLKATYPADSLKLKKKKPETAK